MKIKSIRSQIVRLPVDEPLADGPPSGRAHNMFVTVRIETDDGIEGVGATFFGGVLSAHAQAGDRSVRRHDRWR